MTQQPANKERLNVVRAAIISALVAAAANTALVAKAAAEDLQLPNPGLKNSGPIPPLAQRNEITAPVAAAGGTGDADTWQDPCGGPLPHHLAAIS